MAVRNPLSRERIIDAAVGLLEEDGWDALSMRRLAQELDVWPMAVYRYFRDKDELVDALVDHAAARMELPGAEGHWRARGGPRRGGGGGGGGGGGPRPGPPRLTLGRLPPELRARMVAPEGGLDVL